MKVKHTRRIATSNLDLYTPHGQRELIADEVTGLIRSMLRDGASIENIRTKARVVEDNRIEWLELEMEGKP